MKEVQNHHTGLKETKETPSEEQEILEARQEKYLGQVISNDGTNTKHILYRIGKGAGMAKLIEGILNHVPGGKFNFETPVIFRNAYLISSMLSCS